MSSELEIGLPSVRQLQSLIKDSKDVEIKMLTQDVVMGKMRWLDQHCICVVDQNQEQILVWRHAIAYIKPKS